MARLKNGFLGGFSGKLGPAVGYFLNDEPHIRSLPRTKIYTDAERLNQDKFKLVQDHIGILKDLLKIGFKNYWTKTGGYRAAVSYTRKVALVSDDAGFYIDPALFKISGGDLPGAVNPTVTLEEPLQLRFDWDIADMQDRIKSDQMLLLVYDSVNHRPLVRGLDGPFRKDGTVTVEIPEDFKGKELDIYIGFVAADRSIQSDSQYLGRLTIPA